MSDLFPDAPRDDFRPSTRRQRIVEILKRYAEKKVPLAQVTLPRIMNRSLATLKRYCCHYSIAFPDYVPRHMRPKPAKGRPRGKRRISNADRAR